MNIAQMVADQVDEHKGYRDQDMRLECLRIAQAALMSGSSEDPLLVLADKMVQFVRDGGQITGAKATPRAEMNLERK